VLVSSHAGLVLAVDTNGYNVDGLHHDSNARFAAGTLDLLIAGMGADGKRDHGCVMKIA
jgi:hypothetical protein